MTLTLQWRAEANLLRVLLQLLPIEPTKYTNLIGVNYNVETV